MPDREKARLQSGGRVDWWFFPASFAYMIFMTRIDPTRKLQRFWLARVTPTLLGGWALVREWGRLGAPGTMQTRSFEREDEAQRAEQAGIRKRQRRGYQPTEDVVALWAEAMAAGGSIITLPQGSKPKSRSSHCSDTSTQTRFDF